ncbi:MAG: hypothetical protein KC561_09540, partial [Myxococcales bacterium]|nr:hypothetical protein [Myxococcales bacterium]
MSAQDSNRIWIGLAQSCLTQFDLPKDIRGSLQGALDREPEVAAAQIRDVLSGAPSAVGHQPDSRSELLAKARQQLQLLRHAVSQVVSHSGQSIPARLYRFLEQQLSDYTV